MSHKFNLIYHVTTGRKDSSLISGFSFLNVSSSSDYVWICHKPQFSGFPALRWVGLTILALKWQLRQESSENMAERDILPRWLLCVASPCGMDFSPSDSWVLKLNSPRDQEGCYKASFDLALEVMQHLPSIVYA